ncbi:hypothetical protein SK128_023239 [Halocaridina rubra]|uniref:Apple domain-containing protein n=1 Tax=Halocaridina rubra TaxID=373956 RepID=A0AAN8XDU1_HALRR
MKRRLLVMVCFVVHFILLCETNVSNSYALLYDGGLKVTASYTLYNTGSILSCAAICYGKPGCWLFTWDAVSKECQLLDFLNAVVITESAPSTLRTYYANSVRGKKIVRTPSQSSWTGNNNTCANMGGRLFLPEDNTYCYILNHIVGVNHVHIGLWRYPSDVTVWYNMDGQTTFPSLNWGSGQPNNCLGSQYYGSCHNGKAGDVPPNSITYGICDI